MNLLVEIILRVDSFQRLQRRRGSLPPGAIFSLLLDKAQQFRTLKANSSLPDPGVRDNRLNPRRVVSYPLKGHSEKLGSAPRIEEIAIQ